jgi:hypothetical protein
MSSEMRDENRLLFCMLRQGDLWFMLNRRAGTPVKPKDYGTRERLASLGYAVSNVVIRDYGQTEFSVIDDDGYSHCFGVPTGGDKRTG